MATMQLSRSSAKKRDADTAFAAGHRDLSWSPEVEATQGSESQSAAQAQSNIVEGLLKQSKNNTRKLVNTLLDNTQKIFSRVENDIQPLQLAHKTEVKDHLDQLEQYLRESKKNEKEPFNLALRDIEERISSLDQLAQCYCDADVDAANTVDADLHIKRRLQHKVKTSQRGAQVAQMQMKQATEDVKLRVDTKKFVRAHRDFFKAIQSSQVQI